MEQQLHEVLPQVSLGGRLAVAFTRADEWKLDVLEEFTNKELADASSSPKCSEAEVADMRQQYEAGNSQDALTNAALQEVEDTRDTRNKSTR